MSETKPTERFTKLAAAYAQNRPTYPVEAIDAIVEKCSLKVGQVVVDVGCGTGISSRLFAEIGMNVIGIEPNEQMRKTAESEPHANISYRDGTGEATGLPDTSADLVLAAQAFHWFESEKALAEFSRVLKPAGHAVLMWNERDE